MKRGLSRLGAFACCWAVAAVAWLPARGLGFGLNVDLENGGPESAGGGVPSDGFGGAANQPGRWNDVDAAGFGSFPLADLSGLASPATVTIDHHGGPGLAVSFSFAGNTGDYARLLNDAMQVGTSGQGGRVTYTFTGLLPGTYDVYTYAADIAGAQSNVPVTVPEAITNNTQTVSGAMVGNSFGYLVTHSIHRIALAAGADFRVDLNQPPSLVRPYFVNGFQVVPVPEPAPLTDLLLWAVLLVLPYLRRRHNL